MDKNDPEIGQVFDLYTLAFTIRCKINEGGFAKIYLMMTDNFRCVRKSILYHGRYHFTYSSDYYALMNEARICLTMDFHPNVVTYLSFIRKQSGNVYAILEYVKDGSLWDLVEQGGINDNNKLLDLAIDIANGLSYLHEQEIVHRDLNPSNILLEKAPAEFNDDRYVAKIIDFGLSISKKRDEISNPIEEIHSKVDVTDLIGNRSFVSPEQINKQSSGEKKESDIFAFGMTLCFMAIGITPFEPSELLNEPDYEKSKKNIEEKLCEALRDSNKQLDERILKLIVKCLHFNPDNRWREERTAGTFEGFRSIKDELEKIRYSIDKDKKMYRFEFGNYRLLYQMRGTALLNLSLSADPTIKASFLNDSESMLLRSLDYDIENINTLRQLGLVYRYKNDYDTALIYFCEAIGHNEEDDQICIDIGTIMDLKGEKLVDIISWYDKAIDLNSNNFSAFYNKGSVLYFRGLITEARSALNLALSLNKDNALTNLYLGLISLRENDQVTAEKFIRESINLTQQDKDHYIKICNRLIEIQEYQLALKYCNEARGIHRIDSSLKNICDYLQKFVL